MSIPASRERTSSVAPAAPDPTQRSATGARAKSIGITLLASWSWPVGIWLAVTVTTLVARPPMGGVDLPIYAAAWWTWVGRTDVGYVPGAGNGWPPLLIGCIQLGWWLLGVSETSARLVASLFGLASLWQVAALARRLWPDDAEAARYAPIVLAGSGGFIAYLTTAVFSWPLLSLILLALHGLVLAWRRRPLAGWAVFALALVLGEFSVGASAAWLMVAIAVAAPWSIRYGRGAADWRSWFGGLVVASP